MKTKLSFLQAAKLQEDFVLLQKTSSWLKLEHILKECITLSNYELKEGDFIKYKGRFYSWVSISSDGIIQLPNSTMQFLNLTVGDILMSIKSSDIAFTMGAKGPLMDKVYAYKGDIKTFAVWLK